MLDSVCGPAGRIFVNADASGGELRVRATDYERRPLPGWGEPSRPVVGDGVRQEVLWEDEGRRGDLENREMRLEFEMKGVVDLYGFCFIEDE